METPDPWEPFERLKAAVTESVKDLGIDVLAWVIIPGDESTPGGPERTCQFAFKVREEAFLDDASRQTREDFEAIMEATREDEIADKTAKRVAKAKGELIDMSGGGILPDTPEE